ncbi:MAG TPA: ABC transporter ATP-binding protein [Chloroflexia bacterium]|nr:ABC transporter ATP-binding protein [Chloroflexia bacterium]
MQTANGPAPSESPGADISASPAEQSDKRTTSDSDARPPVVQIERVSKQFRGVAALRGVSLNIERGEIFGLLGPNGAGKSTLLKLLLGFLHSDSGAVKLFGSTDLTRAHARIGYLPEQPSYHGNFSGREYVQFQARLAGLSARDARTMAARALKRVGLEEAANRRIRTYSKGMKQRLGLAVAVYACGDTPPELLVLDEPASGLAPEGQVAVREVLLDCNRLGSTILLCSHQLTEVERICSQVGILRGGRLVALTRLDDQSRAVIVAAPRPRALELSTFLIEYLRNLHPAVIVKGGLVEDERLYVSLPTGDDVPHAAAMKAAAIKAMVDARWDIISLHVENRDLESIYLQAVRPSRKDAATPDPAGGKSLEAAATAEAEPAEVAATEVAATEVAAAEGEQPQPGIVDADGAGALVDAAHTIGTEADEPGQPEGVEVVPPIQPLPVRPVSPNGSAAVSQDAVAPPVEISAGEVPATGMRSGPSTAPLPPLPASIASEADAGPQDSWVRDLRREGEEH